MSPCYLFPDTPVVALVCQPLFPQGIISSTSVFILFGYPPYFPVTSISSEFKCFSLSWLHLAAWPKNISLGTTDAESPQETDLVIILLALFTAASCPYPIIFYRFIPWKLSSLQNTSHNNVMDTTYLLHSYNNQKLSFITRFKCMHPSKIFMCA